MYYLSTLRLGAHGARSEYVRASYNEKKTLIPKAKKVKKVIARLPSTRREGFPTCRIKTSKDGIDRATFIRPIFSAIS